MLVRRIRTRQRQQPQRRGTTLVEVAVVMVLFLTFLFSIVEYGRYVGLRQTAENAARYGARWAVCNTAYNVNNSLPVGDTSMIQQQVRNALGTGTNQNLVETQLLPGSSITAYKINPVNGANLGTWDSSGYGDSIAVEINGQFKWVVPNFLQLASGVWNIRTRVIMRVE